MDGKDVENHLPPSDILVSRPVSPDKTVDIKVVERPQDIELEVDEDIDNPLATVSDILKRHEAWKHTREEAKKEFQEIKATPWTVKFDHTMLEERPELIKEMAQIVEFDNLLKEKTDLINKLKSERLQREESFVHHNLARSQQPSSASLTAANDLVTSQKASLTRFDEETTEGEFMSATLSSMPSEVQMDLQSMSSGMRPTFITEPKINVKRKMGKMRDPLERSGSLTELEYQKGDFIKRNMMLGPEARYYDALTEPEMHRVNTLLEEPKKAQVEGFGLANEDTEKLRTVEAQLSSISLLDLTEGPIVDAKSLVMPSRDVQTVFCDVDALKDVQDILQSEYAKLEEIDNKLQELEDQEELTEEVNIAYELIQKLVQESLKEQQQLRMRDAGFDDEDNEDKDHEDVEEDVSDTNDDE